MKNELVKKVLPHVIALLVFLIVAVLFCKPALEGNVLGQSDILGWKGMAQNGFDYKARTGHFPLWNPNVFGGMPNYLIVMDGKSVLPDMTKVFSLGLPQPINFFFIAAVCFYILCMALRLKPIVGIFGGLGFAFCTFHPVIISVGHVTQMFAIAYTPLLMAGLILIYDKRYWLGLAVATLGTYMQVASNHPQVSYYFFLVALAISIGYLVEWIRRREWKHIGIAFGVTALAAIAGVGANSLSFLVITEYSKATMRGGKTLSIDGDKVEAAKTTGLDPSYAFSYSLSKPEPLVIFMPKAMGGTSRDVLGEDHSKNTVKKLTSIGYPDSNAEQLAPNLPSYWGGLEFNGGTPYMGVIVFLLALLGFVLVPHPIRWGLLAAAILSVMMAWGKYFPGFNNILFEHLPLYQKFRAPSMSLVITEMVLPVMAVLAIQRLFFEPGSADFVKANFKKILYTFGGLTLFIALVYLVLDYSSALDAQLLTQFTDKNGDTTVGKAAIAGMKGDRGSMFGGQVLRTIAYIVLVLGLCWAYFRRILTSIPVIAVLLLVNMIDLLIQDKQYLNSESYHAADEAQVAGLTRTPIDDAILKDAEPGYRVFNYGQESFSDADYHYPAFHRTVGGYHPAKLRIYQDVIEHYLSRVNPGILNMLNVKYVVTDDPQTKQKVIVPNPSAYGACWLVKHVKTVPDDVAEFTGIGITDLRDTALVGPSFATGITQPQWDSTATIKLEKFDNDVINYSFNAATPQFAVFSEVYYPYGWNVYLDDKKVDYVKTDYLLRGLSVPAGKHSIRFAFEPDTYRKGTSIAYAGSWLVLLFVLGGFFMTWWQGRKKTGGMPLATV